MSGVRNELWNINNAAILVVDDSAESLLSIGVALESAGLRSERTSSAAEAIERVKEKEFDVIIVDMKMPDMTGMEFLNITKAYHPDTEVLVLTGYGSINSAVNAMSLGAFDYLTKPFDVKDLNFSVRRALIKRALKNENKYLRELIEKEYSFENIVSRCEKMREIFRLVRKVAPTTAPIIIQGESGTGKELIARAIHQNSLRKNKKFLTINSASLPETLLESELFGYRRGAFTGAERDKLGLLESADRGTLFLDEIGSMSKQLQGKLLRAMQEGEIVPVGATEKVRIDVRFLAASNRNLAEMVESGEFRKDLYYRLNVIEITIPPLRERAEDISLLAEHFLQKYHDEEGAERKVLRKAAVRKLVKCNWPGNVRELENVIRRAIIVSSGNAIKASDIDLSRSIHPRISARTELLSMTYREAKKTVEDEFQKAYLRKVLSECRGSVTQAARRTELSRQAIHQLVKRHGLK